MNCRTYSDPQIFSYCIYQQAQYLDSLDDVNYYCPLTAEWEEACRHIWIEQTIRKPHSLSREQLMDGCAGFSDCAFELLDTMPAKTIKKQLSLCIQYVSTDQNDCIRHAMNLWRKTNPSQKEVRSLLGYENHTEFSLAFVAQVDFCLQLGACKGKGVNREICRDFQREIEQNPLLCQEHAFGQ